MSVAKVSVSKFNKAPIAPMVKRRSIFRTLPHKKVELVDLSKIPKKERWIYENPEIMSGLLDGLAQVERGEVHHLSDFPQYFITEEDDELDEEHK